MTELKPGQRVRVRTSHTLEVLHGRSGTVSEVTPSGIVVVQLDNASHPWRFHRADLEVIEPAPIRPRPDPA